MKLLCALCLITALFTSCKSDHTCDSCYQKWEEQQAFNVLSQQPEWKRNGCHSVTLHTDKFTLKQISDSIIGMDKAYKVMTVIIESK